jgi:integrase
VARLAGECAPPYDLLVTFLSYAGLRFGEMAALQMEDVDLAQRR